MEKNEGEVFMKVKLNNHKSIIHFTIAIILVIGFCFPTYTSHGQEQTDDVGHSGGFKVKIEKIEGVMNAFEIMQGIVDIPEGQIVGLTITKTLKETKHGTLVINIKSPGPIPIDQLKSKSIGFPFFESLCEASKEDWLCMQGVQMTLSEQSVNTIDLPNATVETCYEGQCSDDKAQNEEQMNLMSNEDNTIESIEKNIQSANQILQVAEEEISHAAALNETIAQEKQQEQVQQSLEQFQDSDSDLQDLVQSAEKIQKTYETFNENASQLALRTSVVSDILKQVELVIENENEKVAKLEETLNEANETFIAKSKKNQKSDEPDTENEKLEKTITELKSQLAENKKQLEKLQNDVQPLAKSSDSFIKHVNQYYKTIQNYSDDLKAPEDNEEIQTIQARLDVSEPAKGLEKQLAKTLAHFDNDDLVEQTEKQSKLINEANKQVSSTVLSVPLAKEIGELDARIEEEIQEESETWEQNEKQISTLDKKLDSLAALVQLPETLALEYELDVVLKDKHQYRLTMFENISHWKQLMTTLKDKHGQLVEAVEQYESNKQLLSQLIEAILKHKDRYTEAELSIIAKFLNIEAYMEREQKISELIENGMDVLNTAKPLIDTANQQLGKLESLSNDLVDKVVVINLLQDESYHEFKTVLEQLKQSISQLESPMTQLNNHVIIAEDLLRNRATEYKEIGQMYDAVNEVSTMSNRIEQLSDHLDSLPYFEKIKEIVKDLRQLKARIDKMIE